MASNDGIIWITYRGRKIPIKPGMKGKFNKKKLDEIRNKKEGNIESNKLTKSEINTQVEKSLDLADKVIADDEWNDVTTHRYGNGNATIESERTGKRVRIEPNETRESINKKLEYITSDNEYRSASDELIEKNNKLNKELNEKGISYSDYEAGKMLEKKTNGRIKNWEDLDREVDKNKSIKEYAKKYGMSEEYVRNSIEANKSDSQKLLDTVEKNKAGKEYRDKLNKISDKSIPDGTYDVDTGKAVDFKGEGYNVSFEQSGVKLTNDEYYDRIEECRNKCDGKVYAGKFGGDPEISFYTKDKKVALELMEKYNQHSIWDNSIGDIIENPNYDESKNKVNYKKDIVDIPGFKDYEYNKKTDTVSIKKSKLRTLSDIEQYYINMGYSKATALKYAKQEIAKRKKR